jgi:hypothetical protein
MIESMMMSTRRTAPFICAVLGHVVGASLETANMRVCSVKHKSCLQLIARTLRQNAQLDAAKEVLVKAEAWDTLIELHVAAEAWPSAFMTAKRCPSAELALYETYAAWLIAHDRCVTCRWCCDSNCMKHCNMQSLKT